MTKPSSATLNTIAAALRDIRSTPVSEVKSTAKDIRKINAGKA